MCKLPRENDDDECDDEPNVHSISEEYEEAANVTNDEHISINEKKLTDEQG